MSIPQEKMLQAAQLLIEGNSVLSTERITGLDKSTILRLLVLAGKKCEKVMSKHVRNMIVKDVECDEIWGYVGKKEGHKKPAEVTTEGLGDAYCFVAIERNTKLILNFSLGRRVQKTTDAFIEGLRDSLKPGASLSDPYGRLRSLHQRHHNDSRPHCRLRQTHQGLPLSARRGSAVFAC
mgnify:CR=1 FL=1